MEDSKNREKLSTLLGIDPNVGKNLNTLNLPELNNLKKYYEKILPFAPIDQYSDYIFYTIYGSRDQIEENITNINNILEKSKGGKKRKPKTKKFKKHKYKTKKNFR